jgi:hypothetical protein
MKKLLLKITCMTVSLILAGNLASCEKKENNEDSTSIIGKWKLVEVTIPFTQTGPISYDYSQYNIVYEFDTNDVLTVSGEIDHIDRYAGHEPGEYLYSYTQKPNEYIPNSYTLIINGQMYACQISSEEMEFNNAFLDGSFYYFIKIE